MEHLLLKAATTATDEGTFTAVISTASVDRDKDIIEPAAMVASLAKWAALGKLVPLAWNHSEEVIGHIDPATATVKDGEVIANGWVDQSVPRGEEAWRLVKSGTLSFSFGFLFEPKTQATKLPNGRYRVKELDVFEVSVIPVGPANNDTRVLGWKSAEPRSEDELRKATDRLDRERLGEQLPETKQVDPAIQVLTSMIGQAREFIDAEPDPDDAAAMADVLSVLEGLLGDEQDEPTDETKALRLYVRQVTADELAGTKSGDIKAVWTAAYVNALPDSAFLHVKDGGKKDAEGKTIPRSLRHFPTKDADGKPDLPHLRNALARIPQSDLPQPVRDRLAAKAQRMLDNTKAVEASDEDRSSGKSRTQDPLRKHSDDLLLELQTDGLSLRKSPKAKEQPKPEAPDERDLRRRSRDLMLEILTGTE